MGRPEFRSTYRDRYSGALRCLIKKEFDFILYPNAIYCLNLEGLDLIEFLKHID